MDITKNFDNYDFIKLGELSIDTDTKIVILYARFMYNSDINWTMHTHSHAFYELHFPLHGNCSIVLKDFQNTTLDTDKHLLIQPNTNHKFTEFSKDFFRLSIAFDIQRNNKLISDYNNYILDTSSNKISQFLKLILFEYSNRKLGYKNMVNFYIQAIIIEFLRLHPEIVSKDKNQNKLTDNVFHSALSFIKNNIANNITTKDVSDHINLSSRQLNRIFELNANMSMSEFIKNERISRVKEHLKKTTLSLHEIATLTGFNDEFVLCKSFKKSTGITPHKYRLKHKKKG